MALVNPSHLLKWLPAAKKQFTSANIFFKDRPQVTEALSSAMGIPPYIGKSFAERPAPTFQSLIRLAPTGFAKGSMARDVARGALSEWNRPGGTFPQLLAGGAMGFARGIDPTRMQETGYTPPTSAESLVNAGMPWQGAGAIGAALDVAPFADLASFAGQTLMYPRGMKAADITRRVSETFGIKQADPRLGTLETGLRKQPWWDIEKMRQGVNQVSPALLPKFQVAAPGRGTTLFGGIPTSKGASDLFGGGALKQGARLAQQRGIQFATSKGQGLIPAVIDAAGQIFFHKDAATHPDIARTFGLDEARVEKGFIDETGSFKTKPVVMDERFGSTDAPEWGHFDEEGKFHIVGQEDIEPTIKKEIPSSTSQYIWPLLKEKFTRLVPEARGNVTQDMLDKLTAKVFGRPEIGGQGALSKLEEFASVHEYKANDPSYTGGNIVLGDAQQVGPFGQVITVRKIPGMPDQTPGGLKRTFAEEALHTKDMREGLYDFVPKESTDAEYQKLIHDDTAFMERLPVFIKRELLRQTTKTKFGEPTLESPFVQGVQAAAPSAQRRAAWPQGPLGIEHDMVTEFIRKFPEGTREELLTRIEMSNASVKDTRDKINIRAVGSAFDALKEPYPKKEVPAPKEKDPLKGIEASEKLPIETDLFGNEIVPATSDLGPPTTGKQLILDFEPDASFTRTYRGVGLGEIISGKAPYFHHAGIGPEYDILAKAKDQLILEMQHNQAERKALEGILDKYATWVERANEKTNGVPTPIKQQMWDILNDPAGDITKLPLELQDMAKMFKQDQLESFWEENKLRVARGDAPYQLRHGYMYQIYESKILDLIKKKQPIGSELLAPFNKRLLKNVYLGITTPRADVKFEPVKDPVAAYIARKNINARYRLIQPALDKVQESINTLSAFGNKVPKDLMAMLNDFINTDVRGQTAPFDAKTNNALMAPIKLINKVLGVIGKDLGYNPVAVFQRNALKFQYLGALWMNMKQFPRNLLQHTHAYGLFGQKAVRAGYHSLTSGALQGLRSALRLKGYKQGWLQSQAGQRAAGSVEVLARFPFIGLSQSAVGKIAQSGMWPLRKSDMLNIIHSGETGYAWAQSLITNPKWKAQCEAMALKDGLPKDAYLWNEEDAVAEYDWGIKVAQYKYLVTGTPPFYRNWLGKVFGALQSWTMNYWGSFHRELIYRAWTGRTGRADANGMHKPIPLSTRTAALQYLLVAVGVQTILAKMGLDYSKQFLLGVIPKQVSPPGQIMIGLGEVMLGYALKMNGAQSADGLITHGTRMIKNGARVFVPGSAAARTWSKILTGEEPVKSAFLYLPHEKKEALPTRQNVKRQILKEVGLESPRSAGSKMLKL